MEQAKDLYILGHPIGHSKSPAMYNAAYEACGLPWHYGSMDIAEEGRARAFIKQADFLSINITTPYKPLALAMSHESDGAALLAGGANLIVNLGECGACGQAEVRAADPAESVPYLFAYNVDGLGCVSYLQREDVRFTGASAIVCGTGPTALSIANAAIGAGARVTLMGRSLERTREAVSRYVDLMQARSAGVAAGSGASPAAGAGAGSSSAASTSAGIPISAESYDSGTDAIKNADIILDATSLGMNEGDPAPFDTGLLHSGQVVFDTVYGHGTTALVAGARSAGAMALDGRGMLVGQAVATFRIVARASGANITASDDRLFEIMSEAAGFSF